MTGGAMGAARVAMCGAARAQQQAARLLRARGPSLSVRLASGLSHVEADGKRPRMVDVGAKGVTRREATARATVHLPPEVAQAMDASAEIRSPKGPVVNTAIVAGVMAAKRTSELLPFCHPLPLDSVDVRISRASEAELAIECTVACTHKTGVEMEALTGASAAALCVYDMCKALSHDIVIKDTRLVRKSGGKRHFDASP